MVTWLCNCLGCTTSHSVACRLTHLHLFRTPTWRASRDGVRMATGTSWAQPSGCCAPCSIIIILAPCSTKAAGTPLLKPMFNESPRSMDCTNTGPLSSFSLAASNCFDHNPDHSVYQLSLSIASPPIVSQRSEATHYHAQRAGLIPQMKEGGLY